MIWSRPASPTMLVFIGWYILIISLSLSSIESNGNEYFFPVNKHN